MKKILFISIALMTATMTSAQSLSPKVSPTNGGYYTGGGNSLSWTMGETYNTTLSSANNKLTQGFQQPEINPTTLLALKMFIQGYYLGGGMMQQVLYNEGVDPNPSSTKVDTVTVSLVDSVRLANDPNDNIYLADTVATAKGLLQTDGSLAVSLAPGAASHKYYIMVTHRNALQTWSAKTVSIGYGGTYDFTKSACAAYGCNEVDVYREGIWSFYSGDMNQDQNIDIYDFPVYDFETSNFYYGYYVGDLNGDGNVDIYDFPLYDANSASFIYSEHP